jgi:hypothetical protein
MVECLFSTPLPEVAGGSLKKALDRGQTKHAFRVKAVLHIDVVEEEEEIQC